MERTIISVGEFTIVETNCCPLEEMMEFVVKENYSHHQAKLPENISEEIEGIISEEQRLLTSSRFFLARDKSGRIIGCIRLHRWNHISDLPITKYGICIENTFPKEEYPNIWHVGRFAIKRHANNDTISILKILMICAITPIVSTHASIMLAEVDAKLMLYLRRMEIGMKSIAKSRYYLGSETIPSYVTKKGLMKFYESNIQIKEKLSLTP